MYSILSGSLYCTHVRMIYSSLLYDSINSDEKVNSQHERATTISPYYTVSVENSRLKNNNKQKRVVNKSRSSQFDFEIGHSTIRARSGNSCVSKDWSQKKPKIEPYRE
jgi:hypothetical protein